MLLLTRSPLFSITCLFSTIPAALLLVRVCFPITPGHPQITLHGVVGPLPTSCDIKSITVMNNNGLSAEPWRRPTFTSKLTVDPSVQRSYIHRAQ